MSAPDCRLLRITGVVQGVGYRAGLRAEARRLGLAGWVRNRRDGSVEALAAGDPAALDALAAWARHGPAAARVLAVTVSDGATAPETMEFVQLPTL